uniref:Rieske domain-containing protein n=1 Tax=Apteryx owenii TaxID=8824 RepID=A0A8B9Q2Q6_APTOW
MVVEAGAASPWRPRRHVGPAQLPTPGRCVPPATPHLPIHLSRRLREATVAGHTVLLVRNGTEFSALGSRCPHHGAPLSRGVLKGKRLRCPWHGACFNIKTGDIEEYPALDCLPCFKVNSCSHVPLPAPSQTSTLSCTRSRERSGCHSQRRPGGSSSLVGVAALVCAETLRQEGFTGRIIMATKEKHSPYDRSKLSKVCVDACLIFTSYLLLQAVSVDFQRQKVRFKNGSSQKYNHLLIATGSHPNPLEVPGADLQNICLLQTPEDSSKILELATGKNLVIIGASFVGMEIAAFLSDKAAAISVVEKKEFPFQNVLGSQVGGVAMKMLQNKGVKFYMKTKLSELKGKDGKVSHSFAACVLAPFPTGASPSSAFLKGTSIARDSSGAILVDLLMQTNIPNVFAAGDVVSFPVALLNGKQSSIHHQQVAEAHGHIAALNMLKKQKELHTVPFFWTTMLGKSIRYAGCGEGYTDTVVKGSLEQLEFLIFYIRDGYVVAAASLNCDPMVSLIAEVLCSGKQISKEEAE